MIEYLGIQSLYRCSVALNYTLPHDPATVKRASGREVFIA